MKYETHVGDYAMSSYLTVEKMSRHFWTSWELRLNTLGETSMENLVQLALNDSVLLL